MSQETIERVVGRALLDPKFLDKLLNDPEDALQDAGLSVEERARLAETVRHIGPAEARRLADTFQARVAGRKAACM